MKEYLRPLLRIKTQNKRQCHTLAKQLHHLIDQLKRAGFQEAQILGKTLASWIVEIARMRASPETTASPRASIVKGNASDAEPMGFRNFTNYRLRVIAQCG